MSTPASSMGALFPTPRRGGHAAAKGINCDILEVKRMARSRQMELVARKKKLSDPDERVHISHEQGLRIVEELRRMMPEITGDPDEPILRIVIKRKLSE